VISPVAVLNVGGVNDKADQQANGVGDDMALAPLDLFTGIITTNPATFRGFNGLTVDHPRTWASLAALRFTRGHDKGMVDLVQDAIVTPVIEITRHRGGWRQVIGDAWPIGNRSRPYTALNAKSAPFSAAC